MPAEPRRKSIKPYLAPLCALTLLLASALASAPAAGSTRTTHRSPADIRARAHGAQHGERRTKLASVAPVAGSLSSHEAQTLIGGNSKADCVYSADDISTLQTFERMVDRDFNCVLVYNNASPSWAGWEDPWFLTDRNPKYEWAKWATAPGTSRQLIVTNNLFPGEVDGSDWLHAGASGAYEDHARALARNLVAAGLGNSVIRLADEANASSEADALGTTEQSLKLWVAFWRRTALAMRSVPGAHFQFDWCINAYWRPIPLSSWYPGNDVVNIIGIDAYDGGVPVGQSRWSRLYDQADGIREVLRFAAAHGKPISFPEWGLTPRGPATLGGGGDPAYIDDIAGVVRNNPVAYQSYFYNHESANLLASSPSALTSYIQDFGGGR
jgi:hypothetical protein